MASEIAKYNVFLRIKPLDVENVDDRLNSDTLDATDTTLTTRHQNKKNEIIQCQYNFKKIFKPSASQSKVFDEIVSPRLRDFFQDHDSLVFSYGTSNSGKSYTMQGTATEPGIIPRVLHSIFQSIQGYQDYECYLAPYMSCQAAIQTARDMRTRSSEKSFVLKNIHSSLPNELNMSLSGASAEEIKMMLDQSSVINPCLYDDVVCSVWVSFYEIYNEQIFDLLAYNEASLQNPLKLGYDKENDSYYPVNLKEINATTWDEAYNFYRYGKKNLHVSKTLLNRKSSRSHCVFTVKLLTRPHNETDQYTGVKSFILCDLAGSERMKDTDNMGKSVVKEMLIINASLLTLNKCFVLLKNDSNKPNKGNDPTVLPYRDSKLTMLFKKFLRGQGRLTMVTNISQDQDLYYQTEQVLRMTSLAHKTSVEKKQNEHLAFKLPPILPKRRFSIMMANEQTSPVSGLRPNRLQPNSQVPYPELLRMNNKASNVIEDMKIKNLENEGLLQEKNLEIEALRDFVETLRCQIARLETKDSVSTSQLYEMDEKYRKRVEVANKKELEYLSRLECQHRKMEHLIGLLRSEFNISELTGPQSTVEEVIYIYHDTVAAASEEVDEYEKQLQRYKEENDALREQLSEKENEVADLEARLRESETMRQQCDALWNNQNCLASEADDEITRSPNRLLNDELVQSNGKVQWISDDESSPMYVPPKSKSTARKKKKKNDVPSYGSTKKMPSGEIGRPVRLARRQLLGPSTDYLGDNLALDETVTDTQLSPGSLMKTLRSGRKIT